jgi:DNA-binding transcriptional MerR regulator
MVESTNTDKRGETTANAFPENALRPIGAVAEELGLTARAIRYYEELGLLRPAVRVKGANRLYDASDVERLHTIKLLREVVGFSLAEIAQILETEEMRTQLRAEYAHATDRTARVDLIRRAVSLADTRLTIIRRKQAQLAEMETEELQRLERLREALNRETPTDED